MNKTLLKESIDIANQRKKADLMLKNCKIVDVFSGKIIDGNIAIFDKYIIGIGDYQANREIDIKGKYVCPGFMDSHIHIESTLLSVKEASKLMVINGTTTIVADPHEIVNVLGKTGFNYMLNSGKNCHLDIKYMIPSCVPCTEFETSNSVFSATEIEEYLSHESVLGLGEFMDSFSVNQCSDQALLKIDATIKANKIIDGHSPFLAGHQLDGYLIPRIRSDHECTTVQEANDRIARGMYVALRQGTASQNIKQLLPAVNKYNARYFTLCSDDREVKTLIEKGHITELLKICVENNIDTIEAIRMATINIAECYGLKDRGAIAPGLLANLTIVDNLTDFNVAKVFINGELIVDNGKYLKEIPDEDLSLLTNSINVKNFSIDRLKLKLSNSLVPVIGVKQDVIISKKEYKTVSLNSNNEFIYDPNNDVLKLAVVERHKSTGNIGLGLISGLGLKEGAIALTIAHDSHNIIVAGTSDEYIYDAVTKLMNMGGGIVVLNGTHEYKLPLPIAGLMSDRSYREVYNDITLIHNNLDTTIKEPLGLLSFMALPVIPELRVTDKGLFDVLKHEFISYSN